MTPNPDDKVAEAMECASDCGCSCGGGHMAVLAAEVMRLREEIERLEAELADTRDNFRMHHIGCGWRESAESAEAERDAAVKALEAISKVGAAEWIKALTIAVDALEELRKSRAGEGRRG